MTKVIHLDDWTKRQTPPPGVTDWAVYSVSIMQTGRQLFRGRLEGRAADIGHLLNAEIAINSHSDVRCHLTEIVPWPMPTPSRDEELDIAPALLGLRKIAGQLGSGELDGYAETLMRALGVNPANYPPVGKAEVVETSPETPDARRTGDPADASGDEFDQR